MSSSDSADASNSDSDGRCQHPNEIERILQRENELRGLLVMKPRSAMLMAQLSDILKQRSAYEAKRSHQEDDSSKSSTPFSCPWKAEGLKWARQAIEQAPRRPFGYVSLSFVADSLSERMGALDRAIELTRQQRQELENSSSYDKHSSPTAQISMSMLLARRLIEPRHEEIQQHLRGTNGSSISRGDARHPSRRDLSRSEAKLYETLQAALDDEWRLIHLAPTTLLPEAKRKVIIVNLGKYEYRLGSFFRKMEPAPVHQPNSQRHFRRVVSELSDIQPSLAGEAKFWLATLASGISSSDEGENDATVSRCPPEYIVGLYSTFAKRFETCLVQGLHYQTPTKLRHLMDQVLITRSSIAVEQQRPPASFRRALDLGCGTGLSGMAFVNCVQNMTGVDLSSEMLERANEKGCYNLLVKSDLVTFLKDRQALSGANVSETLDSHNKYDLIIAADVLVYLGDLHDTLVGVCHLLSERGIFAGSTEYTTASSNTGYILQDVGRFAHSQSYLESLVERVGLQIEKLEIATIRKNKGTDVMGMLFVLSKR